MGRHVIWYTAYMLVEMKNIIGVIAVMLVFIGYIPYFRDMIKGQTVPHIYSWILWGVVTTIVFALQLSGKAGMGAFVTLSAALMCVFVVGLSLVRHKGKRDITTSDTIFLILAFISLGVWLIAKQPILSAVLATTTDLLGFIPTVRKSWYKPFSETLSMNVLNTFRFGLAIIALQQYSLITALYPVSWVIANGLFAIMLIVRRKQVPQTNTLALEPFPA